MPIKDKAKAKEYFKNYMANLRAKQKGLTDQNQNVKPNFVKPTSEMLNLVKPIEEVKPSNVKPVKPLESVKPMIENVKPCSNCPQLETKIQELQKPINPTIELWKDRYFDLEKKTNQQLREQQETINRLKQKLQEKYNENNQLIEKYTRLENTSINKDNSLSNLYTLIEKHKKFQTRQHIYSERDIKEREFLNKLLDKLWSLAG